MWTGYRQHPKKKAVRSTDKSNDYHEKGSDTERSNRVRIKVFRRESGLDNFGQFLLTGIRPRYTLNEGMYRLKNRKGR